MAPGGAVCELLPWDSALFGFPVGRVVGDRLTPAAAGQADDWCRRQGIRCLYFLARAHDRVTARAALRAGFQEVDRRITYVSVAPGAHLAEARRPAAAMVRSARPEDVPRLSAIARDCHRATRFFHDPSFPPQKAEALYETWIRNSCEGYADVVLVSEAGGRVVGYVTCHLGEGDDAGRIGLLGVEDGSRGRGTGAALVRSALEWFAAHGTTTITVTTQERNAAARRLYRRSGFRVQDRGVWFHKWYLAPEPSRG